MNLNVVMFIDLYAPVTIRSTVSDSSFRFIFRFESETGSIVAYKMWNCSVSFHGINVIRQGHPSSNYCTFDKTIF